MHCFEGFLKNKMFVILRNINIKYRIMKQIKVLVSSCACNQKFASLVEAVVKNHQIDATVEKVDDIMEVMQYNVMSLPALVVDGQIVARGQKNEAELLDILK